MDSSPDLLLYAETPFYSGAEQQLLRNYLKLRRSGANVRLVVVTSRHGRGEFEALDLGAEARVLESRLLEIGDRNRVLKLISEQLSFFGGFIRAVRFFFGSSFSIVHVSNGGHPGSAGARGFATAVSLFHRRTRLIITVNNLAVPYGSLPRFMDYPTDWVLASRALWVTASSASRERLISVLRVPKERAIIIPNGVAKPICTCHEELNSSELAKLVGGRKVILSIGHLIERKGHAVLIKAMFLLRKLNRLPRDWVLLIEGEGELRSDLERLVLENNLGDQVVLLGRFDCVAELYDICDIFVHPSISNEDLPNVISEAMSYSLPVIATDVGGAAEQVESGITGTIVDPSSPEQLSEALVHLIEQSELRVKLGKRGNIAHLEKFSPAVALAKYLSEYQR